MDRSNVLTSGNTGFGSSLNPVEGVLPTSSGELAELRNQAIHTGHVTVLDAMFFRKGTNFVVTGLNGGNTTVPSPGTEPPIGGDNDRPHNPLTP